MPYLFNGTGKRHCTIIHPLSFTSIFNSFLLRIELQCVNLLFIGCWFSVNFYFKSIVLSVYFQILIIQLLKGYQPIFWVSQYVVGRININHHCPWSILRVCTLKTQRKIIFTIYLQHQMVTHNWSAKQVRAIKSVRKLVWRRLSGYLYTSGENMVVSIRMSVETPPLNKKKR